MMSTPPWFRQRKKSGLRFLLLRRRFHRVRHGQPKFGNDSRNALSSFNGNGKKHGIVSMSCSVYVSIFIYLFIYLYLSICIICVYVYIYMYMCVSICNKLSIFCVCMYINGRRDCAECVQICV